MKNTRSTFLFLSGILAVSVLLPPPGADHRILHMPSVCPFYQLTGLPCPGCGLTRAFVCLGHGQFASSLHWHPLGWLVYGAILMLWLRAGLTWMYRRPLWVVSFQMQRLLGWSSALLLLFVGLVRIGWLITHHLRYPG